MPAVQGDWAIVAEQEDLVRLHGQRSKHVGARTDDGFGSVRGIAVDENGVSVQIRDTDGKSTYVGRMEEGAMKLRLIM